MNVSVRELHNQIVRDYDAGIGAQFLTEVGSAEQVSFNSAMDALDRALGAGTGGSASGFARTAGFGRTTSRPVRIQIPAEVREVAAKRFKSA